MIHDPKTCSWCDSIATVRLQDEDGHVDYACTEHLREWGSTYPKQNLVPGVHDNASREVVANYCR